MYEETFPLKLIMIYNNLVNCTFVNETEMLLSLTDPPKTGNFSIPRSFMSK